MRRWRTAAIVFLVALTARLAFLAWRGPQTSPDTITYLRLAENLVAHRAFSFEAQPPFTPTIRRAPLYPAFLAILGAVGGLSAPVVAVLQSILDACVAVAVLALARASGGRPVAGFVYALHPGAICLACSLQSETLFTAVLMGAVVLIVAGLRRDSLALTSLGGGGLGLAVLCRPIAALLPLALAVGVLAMRRHRGGTLP